MSRPLLVDLFCKAGGCSMGYQRAGFDVLGVDIAPQKNYPFEFHQDDALDWLNRYLDDPSWLPPVAAFHASPPCQFYSQLAAMHPEKDYPDLIDPVRDLLVRTGKPFIIENVENAPLLRQAGLFGLHGVLLCGTAFGLGARGMELRRHRRFESTVAMWAPPCRHRLKTIGVYGHGGHTGKHRMAYAGEAREALGIDWMNRNEMSEAIPPAYTEHLGRQLVAHIEQERAA